MIGVIVNGELKTEGSVEEIIESVGANSLEDAYLKITGASQIDDLLGWRKNSTQENDSRNHISIKKKK
jgi:hypothetical protein